MADFTWGDAVLVDNAAPQEFRPGEAGDVVGIADDDHESIYTVEFSDGSDVQVPGRWLRPSRPSDVGDR